MARAIINRQITALIGQCDALAKSRELNPEQIGFANQLIAWASPFAAGCKPHSFHILGLKPTAYRDDIAHAAERRLEALSQTKLIALDLVRFPPVMALARVLEAKMRLHLKALKDHHKAGTLQTYADECCQRRTGVLAELIASVQAEASGSRPRGGFGKWD